MIGPELQFLVTGPRCDHKVLCGISSVSTMAMGIRHDLGDLHGIEWFNVSMMSLILERHGRGSMHGTDESEE